MGERNGATVGGHGYMRQVRLGDVRTNPDNPRKDMGDLDALAERILATGGVPVNPIVVMGDGEVCRIVDGERRYRAMLKIHGEDAWVPAIRCHDFAEASAVVAAMATDEKRPLTPAEQARGFQSMMALGVPEEDAARATGRDVEQVRRARRSMAVAAGVEQATLDAMIAAGGEDFTDEERAEILAQGEYAEWKAKEIRAEHLRRDRLASIRTAMPDGIEFHDGFRPREDPEGLRLTYVCEVRSAKEGRGLELDGGADYHAYVEGVAKKTWCVYRAVGEGEEALSAKDAKAAAEREDRDRKLALMATMRWSMMDFALNALAGEAPMEALPATCAKVMESRRNWQDGQDWSMDVICVEREGDLQACDPSPYEVVAWIVDRVGSTTYWWNTPWAGSGYASSGKRGVALAWDALSADGWTPPESLAGVREACGEVGA